jgi:hypothetical protein
VLIEYSLDSLDLEINKAMFLYSLELFLCSQTMLHETFEWE